MTDVATKEPTAQEIWNEEAAKREQPTDDKSADATKVETQTETPTEANVEVDAKKTQTDDDKKADTDVLAQIMEKLDKLSDRQRNVEGHIGGLKTSQQSMQAAMEAARKTATTEAPTKQEAAKAAEDPEKWKALKKDFPEWAEATEELLKANLATVQPAGKAFDQAAFDAKLEERLKGVTGIVKEAVRQEVIDGTLDAIFPGWKDDVKTPKFTEWFKAQPKDVQALAESPGVGDAARMLRLYETAKEADPSSAIEADRKQKLAHGVALPKGTAPPKTKPLSEMTEKEIWDLEAKKRDEQRAKRGF